MKPWIRCAVWLLVCLLCLYIPVGAFELPSDLQEKDLETVMADYMQTRGLREGNFSMAYFVPDTGAAYSFADETFMVAASTFKLPLNLYYYELELAGELAPDAYIPEAGTTLEVAHRESLVHSNNDMSIGMLYHLGNFRTYKEKMRKYFTMTDEEIDYIYHVDNYYCVRMMMDTLKYLYENRDSFPEMIGYMKEAQPDKWFRAGVRDYEVAHKYGWFEGAVNDVGIIYTDTPFLLAVYTQDVGDSVVAEVAQLVTAWHVAHQTPVEEEPETLHRLELEVEMVPLEEPEEPQTVPPAEPEPAQPEEPEEPAFFWWMIPVALGVFLVGGGIAVSCLNPKPMEKKYEKRMKK